jgi:hypothetical protein
MDEIDRATLVKYEELGRDVEKGTVDTGDEGTGA